MLRLPKSSFAFSALLLASTLSHADVQVHDAWIRATVPQQKATGAFMRITATDATELVGASTPSAPVVEVHEMQMQDNVMKMRKVEGGLPVSPDKALELRPGGYHVMLMDLPGALTAGTTVPLTLLFKDKSGKQSKVEVQAQVRALNPSAPAAADHSQHRH